MTSATADGVFQLDVPEENIHSILTVMSDEDIQAVFRDVMARSRAKYIPLLHRKAAELGADSLYAGCMVIVQDHHTRFEYGIGFYKDGEFLGHVPFEREFLGQRWYARDAHESLLMRLLQIPGVAAEPRFVQYDGYEYSSFVQGPRLEFRVRQTD